MREPARPVVFDINVLAGAVALGESDLTSWPSPPPLTGNLAANCVGIVNDAAEFALWLSPHILKNVARVLTGLPPNGLGWSLGQSEHYVRLLLRIARSSHGGVVEPEQGVTDCDDFEDNRILEAAQASGADLIVSSDRHLLDLSPWRGIPVLTPDQFAARVDVMRRRRR